MMRTTYQSIMHTIYHSLFADLSLHVCAGHVYMCRYASVCIYVRITSRKGNLNAYTGLHSKCLIYFCIPSCQFQRGRIIFTSRCC